MWSEPVYRSSKRRKVRVSERGFSLMELMTVVVIVGVLSAVAVPTFSNYIYKARATEAIDFLSVIRLREESYRSEFGAYCSTLGASGNQVSSLNSHSNLVPDPSTTKRDPKPFVPTGPWNQLGARPTEQVRFGYGVAAGDPSQALAQNIGFTAANVDFWFVARAVGDLDADDKYCTFEIYSASKNVWLGDSDGNPLNKGWE